MSKKNDLSWIDRLDCDEMRVALEECERDRLDDEKRKEFETNVLIELDSLNHRLQELKQKLEVR